MITGAAVTSTWPTGFPVGMRFHSAPVVRLADAKPVQLGHVARADGAWRLYVFADAADPTAPAHGPARCATSSRRRSPRSPGTRRPAPTPTR